MQEKRLDNVYQTYSLQMVGMTGFEPVVFCSQSRRDNQATLHLDTYKGIGALETTRTFDPQLRRLLLYPTELRAHGHIKSQYKSNCYSFFTDYYAIL